jgi:hypothetical protein
MNAGQHTFGLEGCILEGSKRTQAQSRFYYVDDSTQESLSPCWLVYGFYETLLIDQVSIDLEIRQAW